MLTLINNRYKVIQQLGKGGMGTVYLVEDILHEDQRLALKLFNADAFGEQDLAQFKYEFAALGQLQHPNLVKVYDFGVIPATRQYFFTMEYIQGEELAQLAEQHAGTRRRGRKGAGERSDFSWLNEILVQVCRALQYIHARGFIHYDVKPRNIRVARDGSVKLMDFGLIGEARAAAEVKVRGTPDYIAPELVANREVDHRADLYSLGVTIYEIVTGRLPFADTRSLEVMRAQVEAQPEPPARRVAGLHPGLQNLITRLMAKDPDDRYSSANEVIQAISELSGSSYPADTKETRHGYIHSARFVGREFELARLQGLLLRAMQGQGRLVLVGGERGMGKRRLLRELRQRAQLQRGLVCEGACRAQARSPFQPWITVFTQLISHYRTTRSPILETHGRALLRLMPGLAAQIEIEDFGGDEPAERPALLDAAADFLLACDVPLVAVLEDLEYAEPETLELLHWVGQRAYQGRLLLCGIYDTEEVGENDPLGALLSQTRPISRQGDSLLGTESGRLDSGQPFDLLHIGPLEEADVTELVQSMLGISALPPTCLPAGLVDRLMKETGGSPLFIESLMHNLVEEDLLRFDGRGWRIDLANLVLPANIQEAAQRRLARLEADNLQVLQWAAIQGHWLDQAVLCQVTGSSPEEIQAALNRAVWQHVLAASEQNGELLYRFSSEQLRTAVYSTLPEEERAGRHHRMGEALLERCSEPEAAELLAWHFEQAGEAARALPYLRMAADRARSSFANESAIRHYSRALELIGRGQVEDAAETAYALLDGRESCYALLGDRLAQEKDLAEMARLAQETGSAARQASILTRQVALANIRGDHQQAQAACETAIQLAQQLGNHKLEADSLHQLGETLYAMGDSERVKAVHEQALQIYRQLGSRGGEADSLRRLGRIYQRLRQVSEAVRTHRQALEIYRETGDQRGEAEALSALGACLPDFAQARDFHEKALTIRRAIGYRIGQANSYNNLAVIYTSLGLYARAREYMERAVQIERETGGRQSLTYFLETLGRVYLGLEDFARAEEALQEGLLLSQETGDRWAEGIYWMMLGRTALGRGDLTQALEYELQAAERLREQQALELATALAWLGAVHLKQGQGEAALTCTQEAVALVRAAGSAGDYPLQDVWWLHYQALQARRGTSRGLDEESWDTLQQAREAVLGSIATLSDEGLRRNYLNRVSTNQAIITEWARQAAYHTGAAQDAALSGIEPESAGEAERTQDKLKRVLDISVQMNETHDAELLLNYVMDQVTELSGAERSFLVLLDANGQMQFQVARGIALEDLERGASGGSAQISYTVLGVVAQSRAPVLLQDALTDERFGRQSSVVQLNLRSVLCVPLLTRSELVGMIYADNRSVSGRFSQADVDLMVIFANQAATAIENARLYQETVRANQELEAWNVTLEQRVAERTLELQQANLQLARRALQLETSSQVGQQATSILELNDLLGRVVELIKDSFSYYLVSIWLIHEKGEAVVMQASSRPLTSPTAGLPRISLDSPSVVVTACRTGQVRLVDNVLEAPDFLPMAELPDTRSELALPLRLGTRIVGALDIQSNRSAAFGPEDVMTLQTLADQVAIAIRNAQLYKAEQDRRQLAEALERAGRVISSSLALREVPGRILEQLAAVTPYECGSVIVQEADSLRFIAQRGFPAVESLANLRIALTPGGVYHQVVESCSPVIVDDVTQAPGWTQVPELPLNHSWLGVPLIAQEQVIGMISLTRPERGAFTDDDAMLASTFAVQAAIALENARLYDEITRLNDQLEGMVQQRTEELNKALHRLEKLDKIKSDFIEIAAHELRTPLTVVKGYAQVAATLPAVTSEQTLPPLVDGILAGANRLHEIVNSMLDVSRIDTQTLNMRRIPTSLAVVLTGVRGEVALALKERQQIFEMQGLHELPYISADADLLYKVFSNVVMNAIKFTPDQGKIQVRGWCEDGHVEVVVADTGIGVAPENQELIFEKFFQTGTVSLHSSGKTKFKGGGSGLGLAIARGIVEAHGGKMWVESPGCDEQTCPGSQFHIRLKV